MLKARRIIRIILLLLLCLLLLLAGLTGLFFWRISHGPRPFSEIIRLETVEKVAIQYGEWEEYALRPKHGHSIQAVYLAQDMQVILPRLGRSAPEEEYNAVLRFYLTGGETHTLTLVSLLDIFGEEYACIALDGKPYIIEKIRYTELYRLVQPYVEEIIEKNTR